MLSNLPMTHTLRSAVSMHHLDSYKNKESTNFITNTFLQKERLRERQQIRKFGELSQLFTQRYSQTNKILTSVSNGFSKFGNAKNGKNILFNAIKTPKIKLLSSVASSAANIINASQTKKCGNIRTVTVKDAKPLKPSKSLQKQFTEQTPTKSGFSVKQLQMQIERDEVSKNEQLKFEANRRKYIAQMVQEMFAENRDTNVRPKPTKHLKTLIGKDKFVKKTKLLKDSMNEWNVNFSDLNIKNMIFGVQIIDKNGKKHTIYSNEKGLIFSDKKCVKKGLTVKNKSKSSVIIAIRYTNYGEIVVDFSYLKRGELLCYGKPIIFDTFSAFEYGLKAKIFVAQNNGRGKYEIIRRI